VKPGGVGFRTHRPAPTLSHVPTSPLLCAVVPALQEEATIADVVAGAATVADHVIVVDNASRDATGERAAAAGAQVVNEPRRGYGAACLTGATAAPAGSLLLFLDGDGSDDPAALERVAAPVVTGRAELVLGSRAMRERGALKPHQLAANRAMAALVRAAWGAPVSDLGPMRAIRREQLLALDMRSPTYGWPLEMVVKAARGGLRIEEVPVPARRRAAGRSKVSGSLSASLRAGACFGGVLVRHGIGPRPRGTL
jgi:glycosyltransferase involved in cell wall biosynthesis